MPATTLLERKRLAVQRELTQIALRLFLDEGYEATTVDRIAEEAGISRRTFFRYFGSKEDLVVGKWDLIGFDIVERLSARPPQENDWCALRRAFDVVVEHYSDPDRQIQSHALDAVVASSPALSAAYLSRVDGIERRVTEVLRERGQRLCDDPLPRALAGAASACLHSAMEATLGTQPERLADVLDAVMAALTPSGL
ncbi:transcriptional regulator [Mycobacteroides abscessus subsp. bolletii]|uniref:TetR family transcriptional regulator n=1 Tax=Mycobacteroides abscessus TaxID=36809 RepID=UPI0009A7BAC6|nr:TetR family transcriptional regulator [Mycobacteroides abscessus]SKG69000.1 transcriptional regulator [Mycobacteroides abscessus subsp. bolletii]SLF40396.1 transcriptional regulator [Mycobacteroides abscessus subsp. bolletii]